VKWFFRLIMVCVLLFMAAFCTLAVNQQPVALSFLRWQTPEIDLFWWLAASLLIGILIGWLMAGYSILRTKFDVRAERKQKLQAQSQLESLKSSLPVEQGESAGS